MQSRRKLRRNLGLLLLVAAVALVLADYGREFIAVDRCLDSGRVYDYREGRCRDDVIHVPYVPYAARRPALLAGAGALGFRCRAHRVRPAGKVTPEAVPEKVTEGLFVLQIFELSWKAE